MPGQVTSRAPYPTTPNTHAADRLRDTITCGRGAIIYLAKDGTRAAVVPLRCKSWRCEVCGPKVRRLWALRIAEAKPERFITLTSQPSLFASQDQAFHHLKKAFPRLVRALRSNGLRFEYAAVWEFTEAGYPHIHIAQRGDYIPQHLLRHLWRKLGCGSIVDVRKVKGAKHAAAYLTKYMAKGFNAKFSIPPGHRIVSMSRAFPRTDITKPATLFDEDAHRIYVRDHAANLIEDLWTFGRLRLELTSHLGYLTFVRRAGPMTSAEIDGLLDILSPTPRAP